MTNPTPLQAIHAAVKRMLEGQPLPSMQTPEFIELLTACTLTTAADPDSPEHRSVFEAIGLRVTHELLDRMSQAMQAEREIRLMHDHQVPLC